MAMTDGFAPPKAHVVQNSQGEVKAVFTTAENANIWAVNKFSTGEGFHFVTAVDIW